MKFILIALFLTGCASTKTVLYDSCVQRGSIDGHPIAKCKVASDVQQ